MSIGPAVQAVGERIREAIHEQPRGAVTMALAYALVWVAHQGGKGSIPGGLQGIHALIDEAWRGWERTAWGNVRN